MKPVVKWLVWGAVAGLLMGCATVARKPIERLPLAEVEVEQFSQDTQRILSDQDSYTQAWWVPVEFWVAAFARSHPQLAEQAMTLLKPYTMVAVIQADVTPLGGFVFYEKADIAQRLTVQFENEGVWTTLISKEVTDPTLHTLLSLLSPVLASTMGNLGANMHFFVFSDQREKGEARITDPYAEGRVRIKLADTRTQATRLLDIALPVNALFKPRFCPNGEPAHISWQYCPWDGSRL